MWTRKHLKSTPILSACMMLLVGGMMDGGVAVDATTFSMLGDGRNTGHHYRHRLPLTLVADIHAPNAILSIRGGGSKMDHGSPKKKRRSNSNSRKKKKKHKKKKSNETKQEAALVLEEDAMISTDVATDENIEDGMNDNGDNDNDELRTNTSGEIVVTAGGLLSASSSSSPKPLKRLKSRKVTIIRHGSYNLYSNLQQDHLQTPQPQMTMPQEEQHIEHHHETTLGQEQDDQETMEEEIVTSGDDNDNVDINEDVNDGSRIEEIIQEKKDMRAAKKRSNSNRRKKPPLKTGGSNGGGGGGKSGESLRRIKREWKDAVKLGIAFDWKTMETVTVHGRSMSGKAAMLADDEGKDRDDDKFYQYNYVRIGPFGSNLLRWHFSVMGPAKSNYEGGIYHGRILLPKDYPMSPPRVQMLTPSGRFLPGEDICLSASAFHPETWTPRWTVLSLVDALRLHMITSANEIGGVEASSEKRRLLAEQSRRWRVGNLDHARMVAAGLFCPRPELDREHKSAAKSVTTAGEEAIAQPNQVKGEMGEVSQTSDGKEVNNRELPRATIDKALSDKAALEKELGDALEQALQRKKKKRKVPSKSKQSVTSDMPQERQQTVAMSVVRRDKPSIAKQIMSFTWRTAIVLVKNPIRLVRVIVCAVTFYFLCFPPPDIK